MPNDPLDQIWRFLNILEDTHLRLWHAFETQLIERYILPDHDPLPNRNYDPDIDDDEIPF